MSFTPHRSEQVKQVDVLCYRDYTREGKRVIAHSLLLQDVKLPNKMAPDGKETYLVVSHYYLYLSRIPLAQLSCPIGLVGGAPD